MNDQQEDRLGMFIKVDMFLIANASLTAANAAIATTQTALHSLIDQQLQADSTATRDISGYTILKSNARNTLGDALLKVSRALVGYYTTNSDPSKLMIVNFNKSEIALARDNDVFVKADQVYDIGLPIKTLLTAYGAVAADVDGLLTKMNAYKDLLQKPRIEEAVNKAAGEDVDRLQTQARTLLDNVLDNYMAIFETTNPNLFSQYNTARSIDDSGGQASTDGYAVDTYPVAANSSVTLPFNTPDPGRKIYLRVIGTEAVTICTGDTSGAPCTAGYQLMPNDVYKDVFSSLGLDGTKTFVTLTNSTTTDVTVRAGLKNL